MQSLAKLLFVVLFLAAVSALASGGAEGPRSPLAIVGGESAGKDEFPFIVSLQNDSDGHFCGGALVKKNWVLTAAHCVNDGAAFRVVVGLYDLRTSAEEFSAAQVVVHPKNDPDSNDFDFALVRLSGNSTRSPVALNTEELKAPMDLVTAGWGALTEGSSEAPQLLQKVTLPLVPEALCEKAYPGRFMPSMLCAGLDKGGKDSCQGDSGGPLLKGRGAAAKLAGVVSWGDGCGRPGSYGIYGKVSAAVAWIMETAK